MISPVWVGLLVGLVIGYPLAGGGLSGMVGSLLAAWLGHQFGTLMQLSSSLYPFTQPQAKGEDAEIQHAFFVATFTALGRIAKCDGAVCDAEIQWTTCVMARMGLSQEKKRQAIDYFDFGKTHQDISEQLESFRQHCGRRTTLLQIFMEILVQCALSDGKLDQKEWAALSQIAQSIRFRTSFLEKIVRSAQAYQEFRLDHDNESKAETALTRAYDILAVFPEASDDELKRAYRRLISQHHPDKLIAKGVPREMLEMAKEKTQAIRAAYEIIMEARKG